MIFKTALSLLRKKALVSMADLPPSIWPYEWDRIIQTYGICLECGEVNSLRKEYGSWTCYACDKNFKSEAIYHAYPFPKDLKGD